MSEKTFDIAYLSEKLVDLLSDIQNHVEITLTQEGIPLTKVLPLSKGETTLDKVVSHDDSTLMNTEDVLGARVPGFWQGQVKISDDFDDAPEEVIAAFYGEQ